jgi:hypothetical protein
MRRRGKDVQKLQTEYDRIIVPNEETREAEAEFKEPKQLGWRPRQLGDWAVDVGEGFERMMQESLAGYQM